ncbi:MAG: 3 beta-hydroxysteroid dehydrogenase/Delta 5--_4-isomerase [Candidatus Omnitrophica bacterium ADurb.Bin277]|nr:MAG: 3 beta-hydroxysteroid dehydrogenase/Delta 5-->4-isomerase [Candidatus Omnitrophica bacterium ADurb.Bin277]
MTALVTGGTGFIGSALVRHLLAAGYRVRVLVRQKKDSLLLENLPVEVINGDVTNARAVDKAVEGCSVVFNLASLYAFYPFWMKHPKAIYRINVDGTVNMLEASLRHGVKKFIHTSTIAVLNRPVDGGSVDENAGFDPRGASHYARSKYQAEREVLKYYSRGLPAVILNPAVVFGERDHKPTPSGDVIVKFLNRSYPGYFDTLWSVADADDVAKAHLAAVERGKAGERYILASGGHYTLREIFGILEKITGIKAPRLRIPYAVLFSFTYLEEAVAYFLFRTKPLIATEGVKFCKASLPCDGSKAIRDLGYAPTPFEETLATAVAWYRKNGYVEPRGFFRIRTHGSRLVRFLMRRLGMAGYTDRLSPGTIFFFGIVKLLNLLKKAGAGRGEDGWRKVTQCYLRTEQAKFILTVFNLDFRSDLKTKNEMTCDDAKRHFIRRFAKFLKTQPLFCQKLEWHRFCAKSGPQPFADIVQAEFDASGNLLRFEPRFDPDDERGRFEAMPTELKELLFEGLRQVYNATLELPDKKRPLRLKAEWHRWLSKHSGCFSGEWFKRAKELGERVMSAAFIRFETLPAGLSARGSGRFRVPWFIRSKHPGYGPLTIVCRLTPDLEAADIWIQFSHVPVDGVPAQEVLNKIKKEWGTKGDLPFPASGYRQDMTPEVCSSGRTADGTVHVYQCLDFQPFLQVRNQLNKRFGGRAKQVISSAALLIWKLSQYREFEDIKFAVPVDLRAAGGRERTLGFIFIRPAVYFDKQRADRGFFSFQQEFNRQLFSARKRRGESYRLLEIYTAAPHALYAVTAKFLMRPLQDFVGSLGITIIKKADFFVAPASDVHTDGFIAFSNFTLPSEDGGKVGVVSMKGPREKVEKYMNVLHDVMHRAIRRDELYF